MRGWISIALSTLFVAGLSAPGWSQCNPLTPGDMFLDPTSIPESDSYPVTTLAGPGSMFFSNGGDPVVGLKIAPPIMLDVADDYVANVDFDACIDAGLGEGTINFNADGSYVVRVDRMSGSQTLEIFNVGAEGFGQCFSEGASKEFDCPAPAKGFRGNDTRGGYFPNECNVAGVADLVMKVCTESTNQGGPIDLVLVDHGCEGSISVNGQKVSCAAADAANLAAFCGLNGKVKTVTLLSCSTGHGAGGSAFLKKLSTKFGGILVCGYTGDVETWSRNGRRVWASYGTVTWEKAAIALPWFGDGINPDFLAASTAVLGGHWNTNVNLGHFHGTGGPLTMKVRTNTFNGPNFISPVGGRLTEVLVGGPFLASIVGSHNGFSGGTAPQPIPIDPSFLCVTWACQATVVGGGFADLSTAFSGTVGSY